MHMKECGNDSTDVEEFTRQGRMKRVSLVHEYLLFVRHNRKWWMLPLLVVLLLFGAMMVLSSTGAAPFIYTMF
jgi:hypothetical protein